MTKTETLAARLRRDYEKSGDPWILEAADALDAARETQKESDHRPSAPLAAAFDGENPRASEKVGPSGDEPGRILSAPETLAARLREIAHLLSLAYPDYAETMRDAADALDAAEANLTAWRRVALRVGEELASDGPNGYYDFAPEQWGAWAWGSVKSFRERWAADILKREEQRSSDIQEFKAHHEATVARLTEEHRLVLEAMKQTDALMVALAARLDEAERRPSDQT